MNKAYSRINWENYPSDATPINKVNLNRLDSATDILDDRVITLDTTKATKTEVATLVSDVTFEESTGIITITKKNGSKVTIDTQMEKIAVNFDYDPTTEQIMLTLIDGTKQYIDLSALITQYEFLDTDTVAFIIGTNGKVSAIVKEGSIKEEHLEPNYLAKVKVEVAKAHTSASNAATSEDNARSAATEAQASATAAATSKSNAQTSAAAAAQSESNAKASENVAKSSRDTAVESAQTATEKATSASESAITASEKADIATRKATEIIGKAESAADSATKAQSYAVGGTGSRDGEDADNAQYYYEQVKRVSQGLNGIIPIGTVAFADLPVSGMENGWMYNISDDFISDDRFNDGGGIYYGKGNNVIWTSEGKWDVTAGSGVTGFKGNKEKTYRQGNVNLTPEQIGAVAEDGDASGTTVAFASSDTPDADVSAWTSVATLTSGEKHSSLFAKVSQMFKNVRYLYKMLGSTDVSSIGGGTVTGAISSQNQAFTQHKSSGDHDGRYYTETEINNLLAKKISASQYGAYFIGLQGDYWNIVTENGVKFVTLVNGCCILTSNTTCDIHLDILLRDNFGIYAGCSPHTHMFNMDSFRSALNMSKLTFDPNQTSVELILSANTINAYDTKELLLAQNHYAGNENFSGLRFTQDGRVARKYYSSDGKILWGNMYVCQSAAEAQAGTHSVMMHQGNIFRVDIYGAKYA